MGIHTEFEFFSSAADVRIAGCWTGWKPELMTRGDGDRWTYSAPLAPGTDVQFKFVVVGEWMPAEHYDLTDDGHGAKNNTRCIDEACEHPDDNSAEQTAQPVADRTEKETEHPTPIDSAQAVDEAPSVRDTPGAEEEKESEEAEVKSGGDAEEERPDSAPRTPNDGASDVSQDAQQSPTVPPAKPAQVAEPAPGSRDASESCPPNDSKERAIKVSTPPAGPGKLEKLLSDCVSDAEDAKQQTVRQEDFEIEDSDTEDNLDEKLDEKQEEQTPLQQVEDVADLKAAGATPKKQEQDVCVMV